MYLSIGGDTVLRCRDIVGIFDLDNVTRGRDTKRLLRAGEASQRLVDLGGDLPRTLILTNSREGDTLYLSPVSRKTIAGRY